MNFTSASTNWTFDRSVACAAEMTRVGCPGAPGWTISVFPAGACGDAGVPAAPDERHAANASRSTIENALAIVNREEHSSPRGQDVPCGAQRFGYLFGVRIPGAQQSAHFGVDVVRHAADRRHAVVDEQI